jgi:hypothetical protein
VFCVSWASTGGALGEKGRNAPVPSISDARTLRIEAVTSGSVTGTAAVPAMPPARLSELRPKPPPDPFTVATPVPAIARPGRPGAGNPRESVPDHRISPAAAPVATPSRAAMSAAAATAPDQATGSAHRSRVEPGVDPDAERDGA